jgi:hypothetical protein
MIEKINDLAERLATDVSTSWLTRSPPTSRYLVGKSAGRAGRRHYNYSHIS